MKLVRKAITELSWEDGWAAEIRAMRMAMQKDCSDANLKRGAGGTVDVEFIVQALQLRHAVDDQSVLVTGTREAIACFKSLGWLEATTADRLTQGYQLLRSVEARLRLMNTTARHDLPDDPKQLAKLAYLLNYQDAANLRTPLVISAKRFEKFSTRSCQRLPAKEAWRVACLTCSLGRSRKMDAM